MSDSKTKLYQQALSLIGVTARIALATEKSYEAETCELHYDNVRRLVLCAAHWPSARAAFRLNCLGKKTDQSAWALGDPQPGWTYAYALPADMLHPRFLNYGDVFEISTHVSSDQVQRRALVTDQSQAVLTYTRDETNIDLWSEPLRQAIVEGLAGTIAYPLTKKYNKSNQLLQLANERIKSARQFVGNADQFRPERMPPWLAVRSSVYNTTSPRTFMYPYGSLFALTAQINSGE